MVIIGASLAGLFAAAAVAATGARTMIIERDVLPESPVPRKGVPQGRQPHVLLHRGLLAAEELIPGIREDLLNRGAAAFDIGTMAWLGEYGWLPTWIPTYETVSATRPLLEHLARERVRELPDVTLHEGVRVTELQRNARQWQVVCEDATAVQADLVIDASGRGSRLPHWLLDGHSDKLLAAVPRLRRLKRRGFIAANVGHAAQQAPASSSEQLVIVPRLARLGNAHPGGRR